MALTRARVEIIVMGDRATLTMKSGEEESLRIWERLVRAVREVEVDLEVERVLD